MLKVGLTGGIGSGKTSVSERFKKYNAAIIDTDIIARKLVNNDARVLKEITDIFGSDVLSLDGTLNRSKLSQIIFNVKKSKLQLENILHPKIRDDVIQQSKILASGSNPPDYAIIVVPLLIEVNYDDFIDRILVVVADEKIRIKRIQQRDNRSLSEIRSIISNQVSDEKLLEKADNVIKNNNDIKNLDTQIEKLHQEYTSLAKSIK